MCITSKPPPPPHPWYRHTHTHIQVLAPRRNALQTVVSLTLNNVESLTRGERFFYGYHDTRLVTIDYRLSFEKGGLVFFFLSLYNLFFYFDMHTQLLLGLPITYISQRCYYCVESL